MKQRRWRGGRGWKKGEKEISSTTGGATARDSGPTQHNAGPIKGGESGPCAHKASLVQTLPLFISIYVGSWGLTRGTDVRYRMVPKNVIQTDVRWPRLGL